MASGSFLVMFRGAFLRKLTSGNSRRAMCQGMVRAIILARGRREEKMKDAVQVVRVDNEDFIVTRMNVSNILITILAKVEEVKLLRKFLKEVSYSAPRLFALIVLLTQEVHDSQSGMIAIWGMSANITRIKTLRGKV
jgi:NCAIR mutase (PurE)-related protein